MTVFWDLAPCSLVGSDRRLKGSYGLYHQGDELHKPDDGRRTRPPKKRNSIKMI
jgi:hypothetical protein